MAFLICFTGLDGSGKTTLAKEMVEVLKKRGITSQYAYNRIAPLLTKPLMVLGRKILLKGQKRNVAYAEFRGSRSRLFRKPWIAAGYKGLILADYWWQVLMRVAVPLRMGRSVVCDRYYYDIAINLAVDLGYSDSQLEKMIDGFARWLPRTDILFVMDVPEEVSLKRKNDIPSVVYLQERRRSYLELGKLPGAVVMDGTRKLDELKNIIENKLLERVTSGGKKSGCSVLAFNTNSLLNKPNLKLLRIVGSPFSAADATPANNEEALELYNIAAKNKISMLYLEALQQQNKLDGLEGKYQEEKKRYATFIDEVAKVSKVLDDAGIDFAVYKTIRPYRAVPNDIDIIILGKGDSYRKTAAALLKAGYAYDPPDIIDSAMLASDEACERAAALAVKPAVFQGGHISPTSASFVAPGSGMMVDVRKELATNYLLWMNKDWFRGHAVSASLPNGKVIRCLEPELDLVCVMAHSLTEHMYLLGDYYNFVLKLVRMGDGSIDRLFNLVKQNRVTAAAKAFLTVTAGLHRAAFGTLTGKLAIVCDRFGVDRRETMGLVRNSFNVPHRYQLVTVLRAYTEMTPDGRFLRSAFHQALSMLNPAQTRMVVGELAKRRHRELY